MSDFLGSIGNFFGSSAGKGLGEIAGLGATGAGLVGNLLNDRARSQAAAAAKANMNLTPAQLGAQVTAATQPLNANLVQAITNTTNANLAEQGLSQAPGLIASTESQALAPFEQQNQQAAMNLVLARLGLPQAYASTIPPNAQLAPLIAMLMKGFGSTNTPGVGTSPTGGAAGSYPTMPYPISTGGPISNPITPGTDWLGNTWGNTPYTPDTPPDVGGWGLQ